jgi:para-nitrobenzyl esterase
MLGFTRHETRYWYDLDPVLAQPGVTEELILRAMADPALPEGASAEDLARLLRSVEPDMTPVQIGLAGLDDVFFRQPVIRQAEAHYAAGRSDAFVYRFDWEPAVPRDHDFDYGSPHAADLGFTLGTAAAYPEMYDDTWSTGLADQMMDTWIAFARTGNPDNPALPTWPAYDLTQRTTMVFDAAGDNPTSHLEHDPDPQRREFWRTIPFDGLHPAFQPSDLSFAD